MINKEKKYDFINKLRATGYFTHRGLVPAVIKIMFLKYISEYENDNLTVDDYKLLRAFQNDLYANSLNLDIVTSACLVVQKTYPADIRKLDFSKAYESLFINNDYRGIIDACRTIGLPKDPEQVQELISNLLELNAGEVSLRSTNSSLIVLASCILGVNEKDAFLDCFCGYNKPAMLYNASNYTGYEIDSDIACVSAMIMIMIGKKNFEVINSDFYEINHGCYNRELYDKVYSDGPIGMYVSDFAHTIHSEVKRCKSDYFNVKLALKSLSANGRAFITVPGNVLFSVNKNYILLREEILPYLKSVIALPPMWVRTNVPTFVLVLEKGVVNNNVTFIDAANKGTLQRNRIYTLGQNAINEILTAYNGQQIEGFSSIVDKTSINANNNFVLTPNLYIKKIKVLDYRPVEVIKGELDILYNELKKIIEK